MRSRWAYAAATAWGLAEAVVFFIVPDVLLSVLALDRPRRALRACLYATAGAVAGGVGVYLSARSDPAVLEALYLSLPGVHEGLLARVARDLESLGLTGLFLGPLSGTPYKLYALEAGRMGLDLAAFVGVSIPARLVRFVLVTGLTALVSHALASRLSLRRRRLLLLLAWAAFYAWYFSVM